MINTNNFGAWGKWAFHRRYLFAQSIHYFLPLILSAFIRFLDSCCTFALHLSNCLPINFLFHFGLHCKSTLLTNGNKADISP